MKYVTIRNSSTYKTVFAKNNYLTAVKLIDNKLLALASFILATANRRELPFVVTNGNLPVRKCK